MQNQIESRLMRASIKGLASFETSICISNVFLFFLPKPRKHNTKIKMFFLLFFFFFGQMTGAIRQQRTEYFCRRCRVDFLEQVF